MSTNNKTTAKQSKKDKGHRDTRARKKATHEAMANILERISDGFVAFDAQMNYTYVNERGSELLGGRVWVESEVGKGTTFFIKLPKE